MALRKSRLVGLISAVPSEGKILVRGMKNVRKMIHGRLFFYKGKVLGKDVVYAVSGIGKTNAANATALLVQNYSPSLIINFGVGGAYPGKGLRVGDIAVATKEIYADEGVLLKDGFHPLNLIGVPLLRKPRKRLFNEFPIDRRLAGAVLSSAGHIAHAKPGIFNTVSLCTGTSRRAQELGERFNAICESMEGAAIVHLCNLYGIPCAEVRGISNIVEDRDIAKWDIKLAAENCQKTVIDFLGSPD